jgi:hypothetical protein
MKDMEQAPNGHIFACTRKSEQECFDRMLFATSRVYGENVLKIRRGDPLFLLNLDTDTLYGTFLASLKAQRILCLKPGRADIHTKWRCREMAQCTHS